MDRRVLPLRSGAVTVDVAIARFGAEVATKLHTGAGSAEDHLRSPLEALIRDIARALGDLRVTLIGETRLPELSVRPDFAVDVDGGRVGYIELKRPGHGVPGSWARPTQHDRRQWEQLQMLPNVLYTDGEQFACYRYGKLKGRIARLVPGIALAGGRLRCPDSSFARVLNDFLLWEPERPRTIDDLVRTVARLCRLLRDDVTAELAREQRAGVQRQTFNRLAGDWRELLFPTSTPAEFADHYAQTVTFALLLARVEGVTFTGRSLVDIAELLGKKHSLMGRALTVLTDQPEDERSIALTTMQRVLAVVDWADYPDDAYAMLYERFLTAYDPSLRRRSGVYYTPAPLVDFATRFVDDVLRLRLGRRLGFADEGVMVVDPAMGTGSFLAAVIDTVARTVAAEDGPGAVAPRLRGLAERLVGFEKQAAPFAVAELRIHGLLKRAHRAEVPRHERRFLADTLDDPDQQVLSLGRMYDAIERSRQGANRVKRDDPVMVVLGNPPYVDRIKGASRWVERPSESLVAAPSLSAFRKSGNGKLEYVLANLSVYFWRWATWKVFAAHPSHPSGVIAFVCSAGFTTGPGFAGMREYLRRTADEGWIVDLTPEGHQPPMRTRFFRGNQQPICVAVFVRGGEPDRDRPARVRWRSVEGGVDEKVRSLRDVVPDGTGWADCAEGWSDPLRPPTTAAWEAMPALGDLLPWRSSGLKANRTWVFAPEQETLQTRWAHLIRADRETRADLLKCTDTHDLDSDPPALPGTVSHRGPLGAERGDCPPRVRIAYRPFDRMYTIADPRLHDRPRPPLWAALSERQVFLVEQHAHPVDDGPAVLATALLPDMHAHSGRGGRTLPMYRGHDADPNVAPGLLAHLEDRLGVGVAVEDLVRYAIGISGHRGFTRRFVQELTAPGVRLPLTADPRLWAEVVRIGSQVLWLHTFGARGTPPTAARDDGSVRRQEGGARLIVGIPDTDAGMPDSISFDATSGTLALGHGRIAPVPAEVWGYRVARMPVVEHWFGYRRRRSAPADPASLDEIVARTWSPAMSTELLDLLHVLDMCIELEPAQEQVLDAVCAGPLVSVADLVAAGVLPVPGMARQAPRRTSGQQVLL